MCGRTMTALAGLALGFTLASALLAQATRRAPVDLGPPPVAMPTSAPGPALVLDFSEPLKAYESFVKAQKKLDAKAVKDCLYISDQEKTRLVEVTVAYNLWQVDLERAAAAKFGAEQALIVLGRLRTFDQQFEVDLKRISVSNADFEPGNADHAIVYLKPEKNPPADLKSEDTLHFQRVGQVWKLDYIRTYDLNNAERQEDLKINEGIYPRMCRGLAKIAADVKAGKYAKAEDVRAAVEGEWDKMTEPENPGAATKPG